VTSPTNHAAEALGTLKLVASEIGGVLTHVATDPVVRSLYIAIAAIWTFNLALMAIRKWRGA
jgi:hypothetical protein